MTGYGRSDNYKYVEGRCIGSVNTGDGIRRQCKNGATEHWSTCVPHRHFDPAYSGPPLVGSSRRVGRREDLVGRPAFAQEIEALKAEINRAGWPPAPVETGRANWLPLGWGRNMTEAERKADWERRQMPSGPFWATATLARWFEISVEKAETTLNHWHVPGMTCTNGDYWAPAEAIRALRVATQ